jgi:hypothetical protein
LVGFISDLDGNLDRNLVGTTIRYSYEYWYQAIHVPGEWRTSTSTYTIDTLEEEAGVQKYTAKSNTSGIKFEIRCGTAAALNALEPLVQHPRDGVYLYTKYLGGENPRVYISIPEVVHKLDNKYLDDNIVFQVDLDRVNTELEAVKTDVEAIQTEIEEGTQFQPYAQLPVTGVWNEATYTYYVTLPGIEEITTGLSFIMVPDHSGISLSSKISVNGSEAVTILYAASLLDEEPSYGADGTLLNFFAPQKGVPYKVTYNGTNWIIENNLTKAENIRGVLSVAQGGTGISSVTAYGVVVGDTQGDKYTQIFPESGAFFATEFTTPQFGTLPVAQGGTGATTPQEAFNNIASEGGTIGDNLTIVGSVAEGETGYVVERTLTAIAEDAFAIDIGDYYGNNDAFGAFNQNTYFIVKATQDMYRIAFTGLDYSLGKDWNYYAKVSPANLTVGETYEVIACVQGSAALGLYAHAENQSLAIGNYSHSEGHGTVTTGLQSHAEGARTTASGAVSHAEGYGAEATAPAAHAEGNRTTASGTHSHAEGGDTVASGDNAHAQGEAATASGRTSHAEGGGTEANGDYSHAEGVYTIASGWGQHVQGIANIADARYAHIVGNGSVTKNLVDGEIVEKRESSNAHTLDWDGNAWYQGDVRVGGTSYDDAKKLITEEEATAQDAVILAEAQQYTDTQLANMVNSAPETLNTLNELAAALGEDPNFATTVAAQIGEKANTSYVDEQVSEATSIASTDATNKANQALADAKTYTNEQFTERLAQLLPIVTPEQEGYILMVVNGVWTAVKPTTVYTSPAEPSNDVGQDEDLYLQTDETEE